MAKVSDNLFPKLILEERLADGSDTSNPAADHRAMFLGEDGLLRLRDSSGTITDVGGSGGGIDSGTSFPGSPANNDLFHRTDHDKLYFYDGTRWLTIHEYDLAPGWFDTAAALSGTNTLARYPVRQDFGMYLTRWNIVTFQTNGTPASNHMTVALTRLTGANAANDITTFLTNGDTASNWVNHDQAINAVLDATARSIRTVATETGTVTGFIAAQSLSYRLIAT
jgi:hypothetical protein